MPVGGRKILNGGNVFAPYYSRGHCTKLQLARCYSFRWQGVTLSDSTLFLLLNSFQSYESSKINAKIKGNPTDMYYSISGNFHVRIAL